MSRLPIDGDATSTPSPVTARFLTSWFVLHLFLVALQLIPLNILGFWVNPRLAESIADRLYTPAIVVVDVLFGSSNKNLWTLAGIAWFYAVVLSAPLAFLWHQMRSARGR